MGNCYRKPEADNASLEVAGEAPVAAPVAFDSGKGASYDPNAPPSSRAAGYDPSQAVIEANDPVKAHMKGMLWPICESIDFTLGPRMSVRKLQDELHNDILICAAIFVANEALTAAFCVYWRPFLWSCFWIMLTVLISSVGVFANKTRHTFGIIFFMVLQIMFSAINLQHLNMMHAEAVRECQVPQTSFKNCNVAAVSKCMATNACTTVEMRKLDPPCFAPGKAQCDNFAQMDMVFWGNQFINFMTYAEPAFWAFMLIVRAEIVMQSEGKDNSVFRKLLKAKASLPEEGQKQPYIWTGTILVVLCMIAVMVFTVVTEVKKYS